MLIVDFEYRSNVLCKNAKTNKSVEMNKYLMNLVVLVWFWPGNLSVAVAQPSNALNSTLSIEEQRLTKAQQIMPEVFQPLTQRLSMFEQHIAKARNFTALTQVVIRHAGGLWKDAILWFDASQRYDDRPLYWARIQMTKLLKQSPSFLQLLPMQQQKILWLLELLSRGQNDVKFNKGAKKKILITGFDPFLLDRNIRQSNPSGVAALALDDLLLSRDGISAEIETLIFPVRFADFDQGIVEILLAPYYQKVDMVVTISMGRSGFDLERFPGLRRSAKASDNLNIKTGASPDKPKVPLLKGKSLDGPEFVELSLPVAKMIKVQRPFKVNDNRKVLTLSGKVEAQSLSALADKISVAGSGGGYLSNEISYRSILLREQLNPLLPVGHLHTPKFIGFAPKTSAQIVKQIKQILTEAIDGI
ncbi:hypothetical protein tinsulaeT_00990 [Thalassotalea insulae]|uniref:Pyrrolidone-carboxylate peptidase n=2 Tax=Thalassotalea insulae TaxID=2056778 RepID=A0ABQ6GN61_9GAMM|nr:hypothetical protein tinsulaeT_00990 [Thalassotalea insulae]